MNDYEHEEDRGMEMLAGVLAGFCLTLIALTAWAWVGVV